MKSMYRVRKNSQKAHSHGPPFCKETKATRFQKILDKLEVIEKAVNKLNADKSKQINKTLVKDSEMYKNKRNVYINKLNTGEIKYPKNQTLEYYEIKYNDEHKVYS